MALPRLMSLFVSLSLCLFVSLSLCLFVSLSRVELNDLA